MVPVLNENYFIDLDEIEKYLEIDYEVVYETGKTETQINLVKFELVKMLLDTVLTENDEGIDERLGMKSNNKLSIPFKLAFNSLLNKKLINHY